MFSIYLPSNNILELKAIKVESKFNTILEYARMHYREHWNFQSWRTNLIHDNKYINRSIKYVKNFINTQFDDY